MLNRQGWIVAAGSVALLFIGRIFGLFELFLVGIAGVVLVLGALAVVLLARPNLAVERSIHPGRVHAGAPSRVELAVRNRGKRRSTVVRLHDPVSGTGGADLMVGPLPGGEQVAATYQLPTQRRGIVRAGPLEATVADPFGLADKRFVVAGTSELTVLPHVDPLLPLPHASGRDDPHAGADHPNVLGQGAEDFYALRSYVIGDDLRRVHWPSTARRGELMVRQDEVPWQGRTTVLLDARAGTTTAASFELAVSAVASIVQVSARKADRIRLVTTTGLDTGYVDSHVQVDGIMEQLAVIERHRGGTLHDLGALLERSPGGTLVAVLALPTREDVDAVVHARLRFGSVSVVLFDRSSWDPRSHPEPVAVPSVRGVRVLRVTQELDFPTTWNRTVRPRGAVAGSPR